MPFIVVYACVYLIPNGILNIESFHPCIENIQKGFYSGWYNIVFMQVNIQCFFITVGVKYYGDTKMA